MIKTANKSIGVHAVGVGFHGGGGKSNDLFHLAPFGYNVIDTDKTGKLSKKINRTKQVKEGELPSADFIKKGNKVDISQKALANENILVDTPGYVDATTYYYLQRANVAYIPVQPVPDQIERVFDFLETVEDYENLSFIITFSMTTGSKTEKDRIKGFKERITKAMKQKVYYCDVRFSDVWRTFSEKDLFVSYARYPNGKDGKANIAYKSHYETFQKIHNTLQKCVKG